MPTLNVLQDLQRHHLLSIPFENLDIHIDREIILDAELIFQKVVKGRRGGFCYELNGIFYELLKTLGFEVIRIDASVYNEEKGFGKPFEHLTSIVEIDEEKYLTDVGFGRFSKHPLKIELNRAQDDPVGRFIIQKHDEEYLKVMKIDQDTVTPLYKFKTVPNPLQDFKAMCHFQQTSPEAHFTQKTVISMATENGRVTISNRKVKIQEGDDIEEFELKDEKAYEEKLWDYFGVRL